MATTPSPTPSLSSSSTPSCNVRFWRDHSELDACFPTLVFEDTVLIVQFLAVWSLQWRSLPNKRQRLAEEQWRSSPLSAVCNTVLFVLVILPALELFARVASLATLHAITDIRVLSSIAQSVMSFVMYTTYNTSPASLRPLLSCWIVMLVMHTVVLIGYLQLVSVITYDRGLVILITSLWCTRCICDAFLIRTAMSVDVHAAAALLGTDAINIGGYGSNNNNSNQQQPAVAVANVDADEDEDDDDDDEAVSIGTKFALERPDVWWHRIGFGWVTEMMRRGLSHQLTTGDMERLQYPSTENTQGVSALMNREVLASSSSSNESTTSSPEYSIVRVFWRCYASQYAWLGLVKFASDMAAFIGPLLLERIVTYAEARYYNDQPMTTTTTTAYGYMLATVLCMVYLINAVVSTMYDYQVQCIARRVRAGMIVAVYNKTQSISNETKSHYQTGQITNLMAIDTQQIMNMVVSFHQFWSLPIQIGVALYLLYEQVATALLGGVGVIVVLIPINTLINKRIGVASRHMMTHKDGRVQILAELFRFFLVIKVTACEYVFAQRVDKHRQRELHYLGVRKYLDALCVYFWATTPILVSLATFSMYTLQHHNLTAAKVFTSIALFNILIFPLNAFPWILNGLVEGWVSVQRVEAFLRAPELPRPNEVPSSPTTPVLHIHKATFVHYQQQQQEKNDDDADKKENNNENENQQRQQQQQPSVAFTLSQVDLIVKPGECVVVHGPIGSGKSSLLMAALGEMTKKSGHVRRQRVSYCGQEPWLPSGLTVQQTIVLGEQFNTDRYKRVLEACALHVDIARWRDGDKTVVADRGSNFSGGQRMRLALARCVYRVADLYLLDDPLSAVDIGVRDHIIRACLCGDGSLLHDKARVIVTHHVDAIRVHAHNKCRYVALVHDHSTHTATLVKTKHFSPSPSPSPSPSSSSTHHNRKESTISAKSTPVKKANEASTDNNNNNNPTQQHHHHHHQPSSSSLKEPLLKSVAAAAEYRKAGVINMSVIQQYFSHVGSWWCVLIFITMVAMQVSRNYNDIWISEWVHQLRSIDQSSSTIVLSQTHHYNEYYLTGLFYIAAVNSVCALARSFSFAYGGLRAARRIFTTLLHRVMHAPLSFFGINSDGRVLNRFSSDQYAVDEQLPFQLNIFLAQCFALGGSLAVIVYSFPYFTILLPPLAFVYIQLQHFYRMSSRELRRLDSTTRSPMYSHFQSTLEGLVAIRASGLRQYGQRLNVVLLHTNQRVSYTALTLGEWLSFRLQLIAVVVIVCVSFAAVTPYLHIKPSLIGLCLAYAFPLTANLSSIISSLTQTEQEMISMERIGEYMDVPPETMLAIEPPPTQPPAWPEQGDIRFENVSLTFGITRALNNVNIHIRHGECVGVVGRTGAGKTSLLSVLFGLCSSYVRGRVLVDGVSIESVPKQTLRRALAIIPQTPVLLAGTIRFNIDPEQRLTDDRVWECLEQCSLTEKVRTLPQQLDTLVDEDATTFSVGERQLVCLCRALVRNCRVLCLDEATASVDFATDAIIQQRLHALTNVTRIIIAHRLSTVSRCDRVLVMDRGRVVEFDTPQALLSGSSSSSSSSSEAAATTTAGHDGGVFRQMVEQEESNNNHNSNNDDHKHV